MDGLEAVQKVEELKPDLILLDIGLPKLNGIEAAGRIRQLSPSCKIVFLSQYHDRDVMRAAKTDARGELLAAVAAVLRGKQFVSRSLKDCEFTDTSGLAENVHLSYGRKVRPAPDFDTAKCRGAAI